MESDGKEKKKKSLIVRPELVNLGFSDDKLKKISSGCKDYAAKPWLWCFA